MRSRTDLKEILYLYRKLAELKSLRNKLEQFLINGPKQILPQLVAISISPSGGNLSISGTVPITGTGLISNSTVTSTRDKSYPSINFGTFEIGIKNPSVIMSMVLEEIDEETRNVKQQISNYGFDPEDCLPEDSFGF